MGKAGSGFKKPANNKKTNKKDILYISLVIAAIVAVVVGIAIAVASDDFIRVKDGIPQMDNNWLIAEYERKNGASYYQVGEVAEIEGFYMVEAPGSSIKYIYPTEETNNVSVIYVGSSHSAYNEMLTSLNDSSVINYGLTETPAVIEMTIAGKNALMANCIIPHAEETEAAEETAEEPSEEATEETADEHDHASESELPGNVIYACIDYDGERCIFIQANTVEAITDEEAQALVETIGAAITLIER